MKLRQELSFRQIWNGSFRDRLALVLALMMVLGFVLLYLRIEGLEMTGNFIPEPSNIYSYTSEAN